MADLRFHRQENEEPNIHGLSPKEAELVDEYFRNGFLKTEALRKAGYKGNSSGYIFRKENVRSEIQRRMQKRETARLKAEWRVGKKLEITKEKLVREYAKMALAPLSDGQVIGMDDNGNPIEAIHCTEEQRDLGATIPVDARDKKAALDSLAKMEGLFVEHLKITDEREIVDNLMAGRLRVAKERKQITEGDADEMEA
jgi:hypothetical protein